MLAELNKTSDLYNELFKASPFFQRSINIKYDLMSSEFIEFYIPTTQAVQALDEIALTCINNHAQRSHIFVGPYGAGKSIFAVVLAGLLSRNKNIEETLSELIDTIQKNFPEQSTNIGKLFDSSKRYLPVILSGDEGPLELALARNLMQALQRNGIDDINPSTIFNAVKETIFMWKENFPAVYEKLDTVLRKRKLINIDQFIGRIEHFDLDAYSTFIDIYPRLTAGSQFNFFYKQSPVEFYQQVAGEITRHGYDGIFVLYDEFGRFLEGRIGQPFGAEAQLLQDFAEFCNRTSEPVVHLITITHRVMSQYAQGLPSDVRLEWQRIEGRFKTLSLIGDAKINYTLIGKALKSLNEAASSLYINNETLETFKNIIGRTLEQGIFDLSPDETVSSIKAVYPLHPVTLYCLPELSGKVAQNERTLFTFLFGKDPYSLGDLLDRSCLKNGEVLPFVYVDQVYDYFAESMKADNTLGGVHEIWSYAEGALKIIPETNFLARRIIKTLAIIHAVKKGYSNQTNNDLLTLALGLDSSSPEFREAINFLVSKKVIIFRASSESWEFVQLSDVNVGTAIQEVLDETQPDNRILKIVLDKALKPIYFPARRYIDEYGTIRYFTGIYFTVDEICKINDWNEYLRRLDYADGLVAFILASDQVQIKQAQDFVITQTEPRVIFVIPEYPLRVSELLKEMYALNVLQTKLSLKEKDPRVEKELEFLNEDAKERLKSLLNQLTDPSAKGAWYNQGKEISIRSFSGVCKYVSMICSVCFNATPHIFSEALNRKSPSIQQVKASQKVIDGMLQDELNPGLGLVGSGPDVSILKMVLKANGIVQESDEKIEIRRPTDKKFSSLWDIIEDFLTSATQNEVTFTPLIDQLQKPPWGLRRGIIPILMTPIIARHLSNITVTLRGMPLSPLTGSSFTDIVKVPEHYGFIYRSLGPTAEELYKVLEKLFANDVRGFKNRKQPFHFLSQQMNKWLLSLPNYSKNTNKYLANITKSFRDVIKNSRIDPYEEIMVKLPGVLGVSEVTSPEVIEHAVKDHMSKLAGAVDELTTKAQDKLNELFGNISSALSQSANSWFNNLTSGKDLQGFKASDEHSNILIKYCKQNQLVEINWISGLAKETTGLIFDYWNDQTEASFYKIIEEAKERIEREFSAVQILPESEIIEVSFGPKNQKIAFSFKKNSLTSNANAQRLLATLRRMVDNTGHGLTYDERMELGVELLEYLTKLRK